MLRAPTWVRGRLLGLGVCAALVTALAAAAPALARDEAPDPFAQALVEHGSEAKCRDAGVLRVEGKDYVVKDGDVVNFRFNV